MTGDKIACPTFYSVDVHAGQRLGIRWESGVGIRDNDPFLHIAKRMNLEQIQHVPWAVVQPCPAEAFY